MVSDYVLQAVQRQRPPLHAGLGGEEAALQLLLHRAAPFEHAGALQSRARLTACTHAAYVTPFSSTIPPRSAPVRRRLARWIAEGRGEGAEIYTPIPLVLGMIAHWSAGAMITFLYNKGYHVASRRIPAIIGFAMVHGCAMFADGLRNSNAPWATKGIKIFWIFTLLFIVYGVVASMVGG